MVVQAADLRLVATRGTPVLCVDTCSILDIIRDITRDTAQLADAKAALSLLTAAQTATTLTVLIAEQVGIELAANVSFVEQEAEAAMKRFIAQATRIQEIAAAYGATGSLTTGHLDGHVARARARLDQWQHAAQLVLTDAGIQQRAFARVNGPRTPSRKGKDSMKDCVVVESYIEAARALRAAGASAPIVFVSSNTKDYYAPGTRNLPNDIGSDFAAVTLEFAPNFSAAKYALGL